MGRIFFFFLTKVFVTFLSAYKLILLSVLSLVNKSSVFLFLIFRGISQGGTQRPKDVPLRSYFGQDVPNHNRTKIGRIRFLTYFVSAISGVHFASGNIE